MGAMSPADLVEQLMTLTSVEEFLAFMHPDAEYQPFPGVPVMHGLSEIRAYAEHAVGDPDRPQALPVSVTETSDTAVVRGQVRFIRGPVAKRHNVLEVAAWVVTVSDDKLRRVEAFSSWSAAETAAGLTATPSRRDRRLGRGLQLLLGRPACRPAMR